MAAADSPSAQKQCKQQLSYLFEALEAYQERYGRYPNWLSDLIPEFIANPKTLLCPNAIRLGIRSSNQPGVLETVFRDPKTSYAFEICQEHLDTDIWTGPPKTYAAFKAAQIEKIGPVVPIIRCPHHDSYLNLSHHGKIYESDLYWEHEFSHLATHEELKPQALFLPQPAKKKNQPTLELEVETDQPLSKKKIPKKN